jgi:hypothetical protein
VAMLVSKTCELIGRRGGFALALADFVVAFNFPSSRRRVASMSRHFTVGAGLGADFYRDNHLFSIGL